MQWTSIGKVNVRNYRCGYCNLNVATDKGWAKNNPQKGIWVCPNCDKPTYFDGELTGVPGILPGDEVKHVPAELHQLYREARASCSVSAFTASVLTSRKMLMNIAVQQGATAGGSFISYVDYLAKNGFIPPNGRGWVDHIRKKGNEATHEIALMSEADATELIAFTEMLLKFIYEFPGKIPPAPAKP